MATRVTSTRFVGRAAELAELCAALEASAAGTPSLALVAGESGVGKSRLASELTEPRARRARACSSGDCVELGEGELPYAPIVGALRPLARAGDPAFDALPASQRARPRDDPARARRRPARGRRRGRAGRACSRRCSRCSTRSARGRPLLLVIEDLHWADRSTRGVPRLPRAHAVPRARAGRRHLPLRRAAPPPPAAPAAGRARARPARAPGRAARASRATSWPSSSRTSSARRPTPACVERLYARSEGNPLFAEELLAAGLDGRGALPPTLRDALMLRVERLSPRRAGGAALARLPVARPRRCSPSVTGLDAARAARGAARGRRRARSWSPTPTAATASATRCCARSSTTTCCPASAPSCTPRSRGRSRRASSDEGERRAPDRARSPTTSSPPATSPPRWPPRVRAAAAAERVTRSARRSSLLERALALWDRVPDAEQAGRRRPVELLLRAAARADVTGDPRAEALLRRALELVDAVPTRAAPRRCSSASRARSGASTARTRASRRSPGAGAAARGRAEPRERAALLAGSAQARMLQSRYGEAVDVAREAIEVARARRRPRRRSCAR